MLHLTSKVRGFHIHATDGEIGHVEDFLLDDQTWGARYLVVDTGNWIGGRSVLIAPSVVTRIDAASKRIDVSLTRQQVEHSPERDTAEIAIAETLPSIWIM